MRHLISVYLAAALKCAPFGKNFGSWGREFRPIYTPSECGLDRFVAYDKATDFIGKQAANDAGHEVHKLRSFIVSARDADVIGDEPISYNGEVVGWVTSGGYAHGSDVSMAQGYVRADVADEMTGWSIELLAEHLSKSATSADFRCKFQPHEKLKAGAKSRPLSQARMPSSTLPPRQWR